MGTDKSLCFSTTFSLTTFISLLMITSLCLTSHVALASKDDSFATTKREALEIGIGGGGIIIGGSPSPYTPSTGCPPPPPPPCPPPPPPTPPPLNSRLTMARAVILQFKKRVIIDPFHITDTWLPNKSPCTYKGFTCGFLHQHNETGLYAVQFNGFNFNGPNLGIDGFIDMLEDVSIFHANSNNFTGIVPVISKLPKLFELDLSNNKYGGEFPMNLLGGTNLSFLDIRFNNFDGTVPAQLFTLDLIALFFNNNNFEQDLPSNLGSTPSSFLVLANNRFTGPIPKSIGQANKFLLQVLFLNNALTGCLPYEIGLLKKTQVFDASQNQITGPIPYSFACLAEMQYLVLDHNKLYGAVPELVCKLPKLTNFSLSYNFFTAIGPECLKLVWNKVLDVSMNCIIGLPNQRSLEECYLFLKTAQPCSYSYMNNYLPCECTAEYLTSEVGPKKRKIPQPQPAHAYGALSPNPHV